MPAATKDDELLKKIKLLLRLEINDNTFDNEVAILIGSAKTFLMAAGVPKTIVADQNNEQVTDVIGQYCKVKFGYSNQNNDNRLPDSF